MEKKERLALPGRVIAQAAAKAIRAGKRRAVIVRGPESSSEYVKSAGVFSNERYPDMRIRPAAEIGLGRAKSKKASADNDLFEMARRLKEQSIAAAMRTGKAQRIREFVDMAKPRTTAAVQEIKKYVQGNEK